VHSCGNTATTGWSWPNFWANLASFSLAEGPGGGHPHVGHRRAQKPPQRGGSRGSSPVWHDNRADLSLSRPCRCCTLGRTAAPCEPALSGGAKACPRPPPPASSQRPRGRGGHPAPRPPPRPIAAADTRRKARVMEAPASRRPPPARRRSPGGAHAGIRGAQVAGLSKGVDGLSKGAGGLRGADLDGRRGLGSVARGRGPQCTWARAARSAPAAAPTPGDRCAEQGRGRNRAGAAAEWRRRPGSAVAG
jgi:hypothetical protein